MSIKREQKISIKRNLEDRFNNEFNSYHLDVVEKYYDKFLYDYILNPSISVLRKEWWEDLPLFFMDDIKEEYNLDEGMYMPPDRIHDSFEEWLEEYYYDHIHDHFAQRDWYPMWGTVFEAKCSFTSEKVCNHVDELYELGIGVIDGKDNMNCLLFIAGCGYDFYDAHWIPMMELFGWIPDEYLEDK